MLAVELGSKCGDTFTVVTRDGHHTFRSKMLGKEGTAAWRWRCRVVRAVALEVVAAAEKKKVVDVVRGIAAW